MTKILNRALKIGGQNRKISSVTVRAILYNPDGDILIAQGTTVPTADSDGYAKGCLFIKTDAADGTNGLYENIGTKDLSDFNLIGSISAGEIGLADGDILVGNGSNVAAAVTLSGDVTITNAGVASIKDDVQLEGTTIANQDTENNTAFRVRGLQHSSEGGAAVQNYAGIFNNNAWDGIGSLKTRATWSGNAAMDLSFQTPERLLLLAEGSGDGSADIVVLSEANVVFHLRATSELAAVNQLILDRFDTGTQGASNTSDVNINVDSGNLRLMGNNTTGAVVLSSLTDGERDALTGVAGMVIFNETSSKLNFYNGSGWEVVTSAGV